MGWFPNESRDGEQAEEASNRNTTGRRRARRRPTPKPLPEPAPEIETPPIHSEPSTPDIPDVPAFEPSDKPIDSEPVEEPSEPASSDEIPKPELPPIDFGDGWGYEPPSNNNPPRPIAPPVEIPAPEPEPAPAPHPEAPVTPEPDPAPLPDPVPAPQPEPEPEPEAEPEPEPAPIHEEPEPEPEPKPDPSAWVRPVPDESELRPYTFNSYNDKTDSKIKEFIEKAWNDPQWQDLFRSGPNKRETSALGGLCTNYDELPEFVQKEVWHRVFLAQGAVESSFKKFATDWNDPNRPHGFWQISKDAKGHPEISQCDFSKNSDLRNDIDQNMSCMLDFFELRNKNNRTIYGYRQDTFKALWRMDKPSYGYGKVHGLHWSVMQQGNKFESRFAPVFHHFTPECKMSSELIAEVNATTLSCSLVRKYIHSAHLPVTGEPLRHEGGRSLFASKCAGQNDALDKKAIQRHTASHRK